MPSIDTCRPSNKNSDLPPTYPPEREKELLPVGGNECALGESSARSRRGGRCTRLEARPVHRTLTKSARSTLGGRTGTQLQPQRNENRAREDGAKYSRVPP